MMQCKRSESERHYRLLRSYHRDSLSPRGRGNQYYTFEMSRHCLPSARPCIHYQQHPSHPSGLHKLRTAIHPCRPPSSCRSRMRSTSSPDNSCSPDEPLQLYRRRGRHIGTRKRTRQGIQGRWTESSGCMEAVGAEAVAAVAMRSLSGLRRKEWSQALSPAQPCFGRSRAAS